MDSSASLGVVSGGAAGGQGPEPCPSSACSKSKKKRRRRDVDDYPALHPKHPRKRNFKEERRREELAKAIRFQQILQEMTSGKVKGGTRIEFKNLCLPKEKPKPTPRDLGFICHKSFLNESVEKYDVSGECPQCGDRTLKPLVVEKIKKVLFQPTLHLNVFLILVTLKVQIRHLYTKC